MKKILLVEDEKLISKTYKDYLEKRGYKVAVAFNGEEGLVQVKEFKPDIILLDILMPVMDGITMLKELKKNSQTKEIPVVILTVLQKEENISEVLRAGASHYLLKDQYSLGDLGKKVKEILGT